MQADKKYARKRIDSGATRTPNLSIRGRVPCPLGHGATSIVRSGNTVHFILCILCVLSFAHHLRAALPQLQVLGAPAQAATEALVRGGAAGGQPRPDLSRWWSSRDAAGGVVGILLDACGAADAVASLIFTGSGFQRRCSLSITFDVHGWELTCSRCGSGVVF